MDTKIVFNGDDFILYPDGVKFETRDAAEFFYISRYHDARVSAYYDYKIEYSYSVDGLILGVKLDDAKIRASYHFKQLNIIPTADDIREFYARYFYKLPTDREIFILCN